MLVEAGDDDGAEAVALQAEELDLVEYEGESSAGSSDEASAEGTIDKPIQSVL